MFILSSLSHCKLKVSLKKTSAFIKKYIIQEDFGMKFVSLQDISYILLCHIYSIK